MLTRYRHVIWDWNGTLLDDLDVSIEVMNTLLGRRGLPLLNRQRYHEVFDFPVRDYYGRLGFDVQPGAFEQLSVEFIAGYEARRLEARLHPQAAAVLEVVRAAGLTQSILSAYLQKTLREIVAHFGLAEKFIRLTGLDNIHAHGKADLGRAWIAELAIPPQEVLLIGDTLHDLDVARAMGTDCLLVAAGHHPGSRLRRAHDRVFDDLAEVQALFQGRP